MICCLDLAQIQAVNALLLFSFLPMTECYFEACYQSNNNA